MQFKGAREDRLLLPVLHWYGCTEVDFCNILMVQMCCWDTRCWRGLTHTPVQYLGKAVIVVWALLSNIKIVLFSYHTRFPGGSLELQLPSCHLVPGKPVFGKKQGSPKPSHHRLPWLKQSLHLKG